MKKVIPIIIAVVIVGAASFYGGMKYDAGQNLQTNTLQGNAPNFSNLSAEQRQQMMQQGGGSLRRSGQAGNLINGEIISADDKSITIKLPNGGSKIVFYSTSTKIMKSTDVTAADLSAGKTVMVNGITNTDGSVTATNIQIRPKQPAQPTAK
jgi:hypothetical protein